MRKTPEDVDLLNARDVATITGLSVDTIVRHHLAGRLPGRKLSGPTGAYVFARPAVETYVAELLAEAQARVAHMEAAS